LSRELPEFGRFADPAVLIMASLAGGPRHGYAMMQDIEEFGGVHLEPGTLYGALARLEARGWIEALPAEARRRPYRLTALGTGALSDELRRLERVAVTGLQRLAAA
jgi:DNA-binding PadR family transcriptional regulator